MNFNSRLGQGLRLLPQLISQYSRRRSRCQNHQHRLEPILAQKLSRTFFDSKTSRLQDDPLSKSECDFKNDQKIKPISQGIVSSQGIASDFLSAYTPISVSKADSKPNTILVSDTPPVDTSQISGNRSNVHWVTEGWWKYMDPVFLRDSCVCSICVDSSTKQKNFQTTEIPEDIRTDSVVILPDGSVRMEMSSNVEGLGGNHATILPKGFFNIHSSLKNITNDRYGHQQLRLWDRDIIRRKLEYVNYSQYMESEESLFGALQHLERYGIVIIREVPDTESAVRLIAERIGNLRNSFYGETWDVKSIPEAKNVAYTAQYLGLHMDLLYMADPPGFQFLHCLKNTCEGGNSIFSDSLKAARALHQADIDCLTQHKVSYHYRNAGEHYYYSHPVLSIPSPISTLNQVSYSPPFQAPFEIGNGSKGSEFRKFLGAFKNFTKEVESEKNLFEYRLQQGECVIFNNRRILHGRRQFDASHGERWLKGTYVDTDVFRSRFNVLRQRTSNIVGGKSFVDPIMGGLPDSVQPNQNGN